MELTTINEIREHGDNVSWSDALYILTGTGSFPRGLTDQQLEYVHDAEDAAFEDIRPKLVSVYEALMGEPFEPESPIAEIFVALFGIGFEAGHSLPPPPQD